jgi:CheY-like chemotaxis protein
MHQRHHCVAASPRDSHVSGQASENIAKRVALLFVPLADPSHEAVALFARCVEGSRFSGLAATKAQLPSRFDARSGEALPVELHYSFIDAQQMRLTRNGLDAKLRTAKDRRGEIAFSERLFSHIVCREHGRGAAARASVNGLRQPSRHPEVTHRRILLVEDNPDIGETLRDLLELLGHDVDLADNGLRGVQRALENHPEVLLVDIGLPGIDGYEVARQLRATDAGRKMTLIALTGYGRPEDRQKARDAGFDAHMTKPVEPDELLKVFADVIRQRADA